MARIPFEDDIIKLEQQRLMQEIYSVPQFKISTGIFDSDYFKQPWITYDNYIKPNFIVKLEKETKKMEAKKCDRCGKLYEKKFDKNDIKCIFKHEEPFFTNEEKNYSKEYIDDRKTHEVYIKNRNGDIDMCPDCRKAFKKWFEES